MGIRSASAQTGLRGPRSCRGAGRTTVLRSSTRSTSPGTDSGMTVASQALSPGQTLDDWLVPFAANGGGLSAFCQAEIRHRGRRSRWAMRSVAGNRCATRPRSWRSPVAGSTSSRGAAGASISRSTCRRTTTRPSSPRSGSNPRRSPPVADGSAAALIVRVASNGLLDPASGWLVDHSGNGQLGAEELPPPGHGPHGPCLPESRRPRDSPSRASC